MFYRNSKNNVKDEIIKKEVQYVSFNVFIFAAINIDEKWYERILKDKFEKSMRDKINIHHNELIRRWGDWYRKERNYNDGIVFMKIDSTEHCKRKNFKKEQEKKFKDDKKCYNCNKESHFARDYRSRNKKNRRQINVLIKVFDKIKTQEKESKINTSKVSTDNKCYRIENVDKLQKVLNGTASGKTFANI